MLLFQHFRQNFLRVLACSHISRANQAFKVSQTKDAQAIAQCELALVVDLVRPGEIERLPATLRVRLVGVELPLLRLAPFESSAPIKLALAVAHASRS